MSAVSPDRPGPAGPEAPESADSSGPSSSATVNAPRAGQGPKRTPRPGQDRRATDRRDNGREPVRASASASAGSVPASAAPAPDLDDTVAIPLPAETTARAVPRGFAPVIAPPKPDPVEPEVAPLVLPVPPARPTGAAALVPPPERRRGRRGRRVKRVVRRIELWSVLKLALVLYTCLYLTVMAALVAIWKVAYSSGQIDKLQSFLGDVGLENYRFYGDQMFRACLAIGGIGVLAGTLLTVLTAALINVISEVTGGIRLVVIEEDPTPSA
jgi:hypothetical protein